MSATARTSSAPPPVDFYAAKHHVAALAAAAGIDLARQPLASGPGPLLGWQEGHSASVGNIDHGWTARFGLLDLAMVKALGIAGKVYAGSFAILPEKITGETARRRYADFSLLPAALRDIALVVDAATPASEVQKTLAKLARAAAATTFALETVSAFDVYTGPGVPAGKKSLAFSLVFRSAERTLTDEEVNGVFQKVQDEVAATTPWQIRK